MPPDNPIVTLLTDFGDSDPFVGIMKGVILSISPGAHLVDLTHQITPHSIVQAAVALEMTYSHFPPGTIHLAVVDPGVGTDRRALGCSAGKQFFLAPDNGLLTPILQTQPKFKIVSLEKSAYRLPKASRTFAGRDIFAPAAAHLANGLSLDSFGPQVSDPVLLNLPKPAFLEGCIEAHVLYIDRFGNCITDLREEEFESWRRQKGYSGAFVQAGSSPICGLSQSYGSAGLTAGAEAQGQNPLAIFSSSGRLEIAVNQGNAAQQLGLDIGDMIKVMPA